MATEKLLGQPPSLAKNASTLGALDSIFADAEILSLKKEDVILRDGTLSDSIYRVLGGRVRVEKGDRKTPVGQGAVVNQIVAGQTFGEMSFLDSTIPCANCIADADDTEIARVTKAELSAMLEANPRLARDFYKHMAIAVTQRLSIVSAASAEIPEAPRGAAQPIAPMDAQTYGVSKELSAPKLLKVRRKLNVADSVSMPCMMKCTLVKERSRKVGTLYVFETLIGFSSKTFGIKQYEAYKFQDVSELLRETFTLKREDNAIEIHMHSGKEVQLYPVDVEPCYEAIHRCRAAYELGEFNGAQAAAAAAAGQVGGRKDRKGRRGSNLLSPDLAFSMDPHAVGAATPRVNTADGGGGTTNEAHEELALSAASAMNALLERATLERYKPGERIIEDGSRHMTLFNIAKGRVAVEVQRMNAETKVMQAVKILTLYEGAIFGEMSFLNGDVACAAVVAEGNCEIYQIRASTIDDLLKDGTSTRDQHDGTTSSPETTQAAFYRHLGTYLTHRVRQLTNMVGDAFAARVTEIPITETISNGIFFSQFKKFLVDKSLVPPKLVSFLDELNEFLDMPANLDQLAFGRNILSKYLSDTEPLIEDLKPDSLTLVKEALSADDVVPPRDLFAPVLAMVLSSLNVNGYRLFTQSSAFQPLLDLKSKEKQVPTVGEFKLLQILGEGYEGKVLQSRKKDCGVCYALKVLDKGILASRSRRWQLHCSRELECLIACSHPFVVGIAYSFQTPQYLYMVQEYLANHTLASYLDAHSGRPVEIDELRFLVAELSCGLAHIHSHDIVYRDLKPANVLIDDGGHMRIVDMGMASRLDPETKKRKSVCGTKRYMAPEMQAKEYYNCSVDWFSLGKLILDCQGRSAYAEQVTRQWIGAGLDAVVDGLLVKDPKRRLACMSDGVDSLKRMPFFDQIDWAVVDMRKMLSPLKKEWYIREPDLAMSRQFRNGEDIASVVDKLQALELGGGGEGPGMVPNWEYVNPRAVYSEYVSSPYLNYKLPLQF